MASKNQLQKLVGKLIYIHRCFQPSRLFLNRILAVLRGTPASGVKLPDMFFKDIAWFNNFLEIFNGQVKFYSEMQKCKQVWADASLMQIGAKYENGVCSCDIPQELKNVGSIVHFEAANILAAIQTWFKRWQGTKSPYGVIIKLWPMPLSTKKIGILFSWQLLDLCGYIVLLLI